MSTPSTKESKGYRPGSLEILAVGLVILIVGQRWFVGLFDDPALQTGATIFISIIVQALPFLVLGVVLSGAIAAFVPASFWKKALPKNPALAVPVAGCAGAVLPGCECASVPVANSLMSRGVPPRGSARLPSLGAGDQSHRGVPRGADDGRGAIHRLPCDRRDHGLAVAALWQGQVAAHRSP